MRSVYGGRDTGSGPDFHTVILNRLSFILLSIPVHFSYKRRKCRRGVPGRVWGQNGQKWPILAVSEGCREFSDSLA